MSGVGNQQLRSMRLVMAFVLALAVVTAWGTVARSRWLVTHPPVAPGVIAADGGAEVATTPAAAAPVADAGAVAPAGGVAATAGDAGQEVGGVVIGTAPGADAPAAVAPADPATAAPAQAAVATTPVAPAVSKKKGVVGEAPAGVSVSDESNYVAQAQALAAQTAIEACRKRTGDLTRCTTATAGSLGIGLRQVLVTGNPTQGQTRITATPTTYSITAGAQLGVWYTLAVDTTTGAAVRACVMNDGTAACPVPNW